MLWISGLVCSTYRKLSTGMKTGYPQSCRQSYQHMNAFHDIHKPAPRRGVNPCVVRIPPRRGGVPVQNIVDFLCERLPRVSRVQWLARLAAEGVLNAQGLPVAAQDPCPPGAWLWYWREIDDEPDIPFEVPVLFRDAHLVVADKPHFLPMTPKGRYARHTLLARLQATLGLNTLVPIHRLDRETAGVVVLCVRPQDRAAYQQLFRQRQVRKVYEAMAPWRSGGAWPQERHSRIVESPTHFMQRVEAPGEPNAHTTIELLAHDAHWGHYRLHPHTGQTHQLRVHMNALGLPLCGDRIYPVLQPEPPAGGVPDFSAPLQLLARSIEFTDPITGQARTFSSQRALCALSDLYTVYT